MSKIKTFLKLFKEDKRQLYIAIYNNIVHLGITNILPDKLYLKITYKIRFGEKLDFNNPKTFNQKLQWLKLYDRNPRYINMVDKILVKEYVSDIIGKEYVIPTLGVYNSFDDINFEELPDKFVIKCNHDSGSIVICNDKKKFDYIKAKKKINKGLETDAFFWGREWPYKNVKPKIIVEKYMSTEEQKELLDYKFFCFNGEPKFLYVSEGLSNHSTATISFADMNYELTKFHRKDYKPFEKLPPKPKNFEEMKELARKLSKDIPFLRVDLYEIEGKIYFGELTFYPASGYLPFEPEEYDKFLGDMLELPKEKIEEKNEK